MLPTVRVSPVISFVVLAGATRALQNTFYSPSVHCLSGSVLLSVSLESLFATHASRCGLTSLSASLNL